MHPLFLLYCISLCLTLLFAISGRILLTMALPKYTIGISLNSGILLCHDETLDLPLKFLGRHQHSLLVNA